MSIEFGCLQQRPVWLGAMLALLLASCSGRSVSADSTATEPVVSVVRVARKALQRTLTVSSELVPFQQIDVYAKESGFISKINVDFGSHVRAGEVMAVLEIPELQIQLEVDQADIKDAASQVRRAQEELERVRAEHQVTHVEFARLDQVAKSRPGLVAQQELDDKRAKDLATEAQVASATSAVESAESVLSRAQANLRRNQALFNYSQITAPFTGVVTKRYANLGTLIQSGIHSSTQALPLVQLSQDDLFRLVIPVPESYVPSIRIGDPVDVRVPSLNKSFPGKVTRFSIDVEANTRTMHTEVDVPNEQGVLLPGLYAEATLILDRRNEALAVPPEAVNIEGDRRTVWVVDSSNTVQLRPVELGLETPLQMEIVSGLQEGALVAVGDRSALRAGEKVQPKEVQLLQYRGEPQNHGDK